VTVRYVSLLQSLVTRLSHAASRLAFIYVDDILIVWIVDDTAILDADIKQLHARFQLTMRGEAKHIVGIEVIIDRSAGTIKLAQTAYLQRVCDEVGLFSVPALEPSLIETRLQRKGKHQLLPPAEPAAQSEQSTAEAQTQQSILARRICAANYREVCGELHSLQHRASSQLTGLLSR
jgi:hypothetical protein